MDKKIIPVFKPSMTEKEIEYVTDVLRSGWITFGPKTREFESRFSDFCRTKYAVGLNSGTAAMHLALAAFNINSGEVIVPAITFISTALVANYCNAKPVFADIREDTLNIDVEDVKRKITEKTKAIIVVHYGGHPVEMDEILETARDRGIRVIEDAAHACGSLYKGKPAGSLGDAGCFSFHAVKNLTTGDGGMLTTNIPEVAERAKLLRWFGIDKSTHQRSGKASYSWRYEVKELGFKSHMNDIIAALGIAQLERLKETNRRRKEITKIYNEAFADINGIETPVVKEYAESSHHNYVAKIENRDRFMEHMQKLGISTSVHYLPLHMHKIYSNVPADVPVADRIWKRLVTLPLYPDMKQEDIDRVISGVKSFFNL